MTTQFRHPADPSVTAYFDGLARTYAQHRPSYPADAIDFILAGLNAGVRAADVGCGTGISSRLLAGHGAQVIGIDPNADMLEEARAQKAAASEGSIEYRVGTGEHTALHDASVDVVVCAQSFHWFEASAALSEFHRILTPSGRLALMWNVRDDRDALTAGYSDVAHRAQCDAVKRGVVVHEERYGDPMAGKLFSNRRQRSFPNPQELDVQGLLGRARSASYFPKQGSLRDEFDRELRALFDRFQQRGRIVLHHQTEVTMADRTQ